MIGSPVSGLLRPFAASIQAGIKIENGISPVCPPPSPPLYRVSKESRSPRIGYIPCAHTTSTPGRTVISLFDKSSALNAPRSSALVTCYTGGESLHSCKNWTFAHLWMPYHAMMERESANLKRIRKSQIHTSSPQSQLCATSR